MFTGASQTTEHERELSEVLWPIVQQKPRCRFIRLGRPPKCALGEFVASPTCSLHIPDPEPPWVSGFREMLIDSTPFLLLCDYRAFPSCSFSVLEPGCLWLCRLGGRWSCATLRKMAMLTGLVPRSYLTGAAQIEGGRCGYYLIALFLGTGQMATEPRLQEDTEEGKPQRGIKALEVVAPLATRKCALHM